MRLTKIFILALLVGTFSHVTKAAKPVSSEDVSFFVKRREGTNDYGNHFSHSEVIISVNGRPKGSFFVKADADVVKEFHIDPLKRKLAESKSVQIRGIGGESPTIEIGNLREYLSRSFVPKDVKVEAAVGDRYSSDRVSFEFNQVEMLAHSTGLTPHPVTLTSVDVKIDGKIVKTFFIHGLAEEVKAMLNPAIKNIKSGKQIEVFKSIFMQGEEEWIPRFKRSGTHVNEQDLANILEQSFKPKDIRVEDEGNLRKSPATKPTSH